MTAPKEIKVYAVVGADGYVFRDTARRLRRDAIKAGLDDFGIMAMSWDVMKKCGFSVRRFRLVPDDAATEMETK